MDKRIEKTRQLITDTFMELLEEKGFEKLTIRDISERANINRGTFYLHYIDKYDLLDQCIESYVAELLMYCSEDKTVKLRESAFLNVFTYLKEHLPLYKLLLKNDKFGLFRNKLYSTMLEQVNIFVDTMPTNIVSSTEVTTQFLVTGFLGVIEWWLTNSTPCSPQEITNQLLSFLEPYAKDLMD